MLLPSKELLSEVLGCNIKDIYKINSNPNFGNNELVYSISGVGDILSINIYELAHKCKELAFDKGYALFGGIDNKTFEVPKTVCTVNYKIYNSWTYKCFYADTEHEAIFKACEWIMEQAK